MIRLSSTFNKELNLVITFPLDSIHLSDPAILADKITKMYCMTRIFTSKNPIFAEFVARE